MRTATLTTIQTLVESDPPSPEQRQQLTALVSPGSTRREMGTLRQVAEILGCHPRTCQRYAIEGKLHPVRLSPRKIRWDLNEARRLATGGADGGRDGAAA